jgi:hypothetical protein
LYLLTTILSAGDAKEITVSDLKKHVTYLAGDDLQGRKPGTLQNEQAAQYSQRAEKIQNAIAGGPRHAEIQHRRLR